MAAALEGKVAIVTGASRGIGEATVKELASNGAKVALGARSKDSLDKVVAAIADAGGEALAVETDVSKMEDLDNLVNQTKDRFGGVDILINNAGLMPKAKQIYNYEPDEWDYVMDVNAKSAWYLSKLVHPLMRERGGGAVVNISSTSGLHHDIGLGLYGISKATLAFITIVCAKEWARDRIRVNALAPGVVKTDLAKPILDYLETHEAPPNLLNMVGDPEDVARLIRFLVSEEGRYITGDIIRIDGGELL